jgi:hypothetical protein
MPVLGLIAVLSVGALTTAYINETSRSGAVVLSNDLLDAIGDRISVQIASYLGPAVQLLESAHAIGGERGVFTGGEAASAFMLSRLEKFPQIAGFSYADPEGNFIYLTRHARGGFDSKLIDRRSNAKRVTWRRLGRNGEVVETSEDPADAYDPRTRPWYTGAVKEGHAHWTSAYLFFTLRRPGITYSLPHYSENRGLVAVSGIDIELAALGSFLKRLDIGAHGRALVVDGQGRVIAYPSDKWLAGTSEGSPLPRLDELNDPALTRIYNRLRLEGFAPRVLDVDDHRAIIASQTLQALTGRNWSVLIVVPESDFAPFVASGNWTAIALSAVVFLLVAAMAVLMTWRSTRAARRDAAARQMQLALEARARTLTELAAGSNLMDRSSLEAVRHALERIVGLLNAKRAGVWYLASTGRTLVCEDNFDSGPAAHTAGAELHRDEFPSLFVALQSITVIDAPHAERDPRTQELAARYLQPLGVQGVHIAPIHSGTRLLGMLKIEDPQRGGGNEGLVEFCAALASLFALRYLSGSNAVTSMAPPTAGVEQRTNRALGHRRTALEYRLLRQSASMAKFAAAQVEQAAVAVVKLPEWLSLGLTTEGGAARMDAMIVETRRTVEHSDLSYAALLDDQIVLAAFSGDPTSIAADAQAVALAALGIRDRLVELSAGWGDGSEFRMALDVGPVMVSGLEEGAARSLWGGAIGVAKVLAAAGSRRAIIASETAYDILSGNFLFRQRGSYFLPETGTMRTFVLVGAL